MIKISKQTDYALQFLIELSNLEKNELLGLRMFSTKSSISFLFLQKIARAMRKADLIIAEKGKNGGYKLKKPISKISLNDVIEAVEGPYGPTDCSKLNGICKRSSKCTIKKGMSKINADLIKYLKKITLENKLRI